MGRPRCVLEGVARDVPLQFGCFCRPKGENRTAQAAFATLRRARSLHSAWPSESAATKALRSLAFRPGNVAQRRLFKYLQDRTCARPGKVPAAFSLATARCEAA
jgi:hypothetical protein